ncbi:hypothetical protein L484_019723 [Morus notabilis]|uniref:Late embryogenesis abundant protein n=1 Tax=Morus notabilis TaxID=981085 RepID=W9QN32_9ROSA|nr:late embryogenesis abundant protein At5g17165 [Morus notabilis]EXB29189.1 hypothetical protein L484_019723 [Morus notabilis]
MAANSSSRGIVNFGKRIAEYQIWTRDPSRHRSALSSSAATVRRAAHTSAYDKNPDEHTNPSVLPDEVIPPTSDKYWAPDPQTGVFGPATKHSSDAGGGRDFQAAAPADAGGEGSVLEQKAWFRPTSIEDLEKPPMH